MSTHDWNHAISTLGWTLIHFLWQGLLLALLLEAWLFLSRGRPAHERYLAGCGALLAMVLAPAASFAWLWTRGAPSLTDASFGVLPSAGGGASAASLGAGWTPWVVGSWALGALLCSLRIAGGLWQVRRLHRRHAGAELSADWSLRFERLVSEFGVRAQARVVDCAAVAVPTAIGWLKPVVLLPARIFSGLSEEQIEALIAHELAHIARYDYLVNIAQSLVEALLFYHPAVWWISRGIRVEREYCCDDRAVAATQDGLSYARALTALESWRGGELQLGVSTLGGSFMHRIRRLVGGEAGSNAHFRPVHSLGALIVLSSMGATAFGFAHWTEPATPHDCQCCCHPESTRVDLTLPEPRRWVDLTQPQGKQLVDLSLPQAQQEVRVRLLRKKEVSDESLPNARYRKVGDEFVTYDVQAGEPDTFVWLRKQQDIEVERQDLYFETVELEAGQTIITRPETFTYEVTETVTAPKASETKGTFFYVAPRTLRGFYYRDTGAEAVPEPEVEVRLDATEPDWIFEARSADPRGEDFELDYTSERLPEAEPTETQVDFRFYDDATLPGAESEVEQGPWLHLETVFEAESGVLEIRPILIHAKERVRITVPDPDPKLQLRYRTLPAKQKVHLNRTRYIEDAGPQER